jgi:ArsR family transcriptional regulator
MQEPMPHSKLSNLNTAELSKANTLIRAIAHPLRVKILNYIGQNQPTNVNSIYKELKLDQSITSQHLRILKDAKVLNSTRKGKEIFYEVSVAYLSSVMLIVKQYF